MIPMSAGQIREYYSQPEISKAMLEFCENRETVPVYNNDKFGKRPDAIFYQRDFQALINNGAAVFLSSLERWANPLSLRTGMKREEMDRLRLGWDFVIDIDCKRDLSYAKRAAIIILDMLEMYGVQSYTVKFSGSRGFHIILPFEIFPETFGGRPTKDQFPELPRMLIDYIIDFTKKEMRKEFNEDPATILELDRGVISQRHLVRVPYSLHFKTGLASIYLTREGLENFEPEHAKPGNFSVLNMKLNPKGSETSTLLGAAKLWEQSKSIAIPRKHSVLQHGDFKLLAGAVPTEFFPPCMKSILAGLKDGRKRSVFLLVTFLAHVGWSQSDIFKLLEKWNGKNSPPLEESHIAFTLHNQFSRREPQMAPNCSNQAYYKDIGVCHPDSFCKSVQNPVTYALKKFKNGKKQFFRGRWMRCVVCGHAWKIRKGYGLPARCGRCGSKNIRLVEDNEFYRSNKFRRQKNV